MGTAIHASSDASATTPINSRGVNPSRSRLTVIVRFVRTSEYTASGCEFVCGRAGSVQGPLAGNPASDCADGENDGAGQDQKACYRHGSTTTAEVSADEHEDAGQRAQDARQAPMMPMAHALRYLRNQVRVVFLILFGDIRLIRQLGPAFRRIVGLFAHVRTPVWHKARPGQLYQICQWLGKAWQHAHEDGDQYAHLRGQQT